MTDPFSIAAGVAALVALAGTTSKSFYQFFRSIYNAPDAARDLAAALYTLNGALSQLQQSLLDPEFVRVGDDIQIKAIQKCLANCTAAFDTIRAKIEASGLASNEQTFSKKAWEAVKSSFNEEQMKDCLNRIEREKTTLILIVDVFSARLDAGIMMQIRETKALAQKTDRRLKDIHTFCQRIADAGYAQSKWISAFSGENIQTTAFPLSSAYDASEMKRLLRSSGSVLSLTLGDMSEDSASAICRPEPRSEVPLKRIVSTIESGRPAKDSTRLFRSKAHTAPLSLKAFSKIVWVLKRLAKSHCLPRVQHKHTVVKHFIRLKSCMVTAVEKVRDAHSTIGFKKIFEMQRQHLLQQEQMTRQPQMPIDKQKKIVQPQGQAGRLSVERSPSTHSDTQHTNIGEDTAAGEDPPIRRIVQINEDDSNAVEDEKSSGKQHRLKRAITWN